MKCYFLYPIFVNFIIFDNVDAKCIRPLFVNGYRTYQILKEIKPGIWVNILNYGVWECL